jgi:hypothetical protein
VADLVARELPDGTYRIGSLRRADAGLVVQWTDGTEQTFPVLPLSWIPLVEGTLKHQAFTEPEALRAHCAGDPAGVLARVLREANKPLTRPDVDNVLRSARLSDPDISALWKAGQKALLKNPHVRRDGKPVRYWWSEEEVDPYAGLRASPPAAALAELVKTKDDQARAALIGAVTRRRDDQLLVSVLAAAVDAGAAPDEAAVSFALQTPLASATAEPDLTEPVFAAAAPRLDDTGWWVLAAWPRASRSVDGHEYRADQHAARIQLARAADELSSSNPKETADYLPAAERLVDRTRPEEADPLRMVELLRMSEGAARYGARGSELVDACLREWIDAAIDNAGTALNQLGTDGLRRALQLLPFARHSLRPRVMARLGQLRPEEVAAPPWWSDVTATDILGVAEDTELRRLLLSDPLLDKVVQPTLSREVSTTRDPRRLFSVLAGHPDVVRVLDPRDVGAALLRIGETSQFVADVVAPLRSSTQVAELRNRLAEAQALVAVRDGALQYAEVARSELAEKVGRLESRLRANAQGATASTEADLRLARLEALRALADALIELDFLAHARVGPDVVSERLRSIAKSSGLAPIGESGQIVQYDPRLHDPLGVAHSPGDRLSVGRVGYALTGTNGDVVLRKAQVVEGTMEDAGSTHGSGT